MTVGLPLDTVVYAAAEQVSCELGGEVVVLSLETGEYFGLNAVAAAAWSHLQNPISVAALRDLLLEEFSGVSEEQCTEELGELLAELVAQGLVHARPAAPAREA